MATVYVTEYQCCSVDAAGRAVPVGFGAPIAHSTVAVGAAAQSNAFSAQTHLIRVHTDAICSILVGTNPIASVATSMSRMAANQTEYFGVMPGDRLGVISNT